MALRKGKNCDSKSIMASLIGWYYVQEGSTVRETALVFGISKSTVHKYIHKYVRDEELRKLIREQLKKNTAERHLRGGDKTRQKYKELIE